MFSDLFCICGLCCFPRLTCFEKFIQSLIFFFFYLNFFTALKNFFDVFFNGLISSFAFFFSFSYLSMHTVEIKLGFIEIYVLFLRA